MRAPWGHPGARLHHPSRPFSAQRRSSLVSCLCGGTLAPQPGNAGRLNARGWGDAEAFTSLWDRAPGIRELVDPHARYSTRTGGGTGTGRDPPREQYTNPTQRRVSALEGGCYPGPPPATQPPGGLHLPARGPAPAPGEWVNNGRATSRRTVASRRGASFISSTPRGGTRTPFPFPLSPVIPTGRFPGMSRAGGTGAVDLHRHSFIHSS